MSAIKMAITGAGGVGKTTLAQRLAAELSVPFLEETARVLCAEMGYQRIGEIPDQEGFKRKVLEKQIEQESKHGSFVADRSALDCWILWQRWNICSAMTYDTEFIYDTVRNHVMNYSHILYIPPLFKPEEDGFRWTEPDYIKQIDRITRMSFFDLQVWDRVLQIKSDEIDGRVSEVLSWLDKAASSSH